MVTLTCYNSGAVTISDGEDRQVHLGHEAANRLIMAARMKSVDGFVEKLPALISDTAIARAISETIQRAEGSDRWNLKEKLARFHDLIV